VIVNRLNPITLPDQRGSRPIRALIPAPSADGLMTRQHWLVDRLFSAIPGVAHTIIKPGFFADDYMVTIGASARSRLWLPSP
jgi:hypothetical protein